jgi:hypothetical protein
MSNSSVFRTSVGSKSVLIPGIEVSVQTVDHRTGNLGFNPNLALGLLLEAGRGSSVEGSMELFKNPRMVQP